MTTNFRTTVSTIGKPVWMICMALFGVAFVAAVAQPQSASAQQVQPAPTSEWAFEATFDGDPASPSQDLLPRSFDYAVTHRTHPMEQFTKVYAPFPADHDENCAGPDPAVQPLPQHDVVTRNNTNGDDIDDSYFICKNHMMSAMGEVEFYSLNAFWPKQEFDFSDGGLLEFEVNINEGHVDRSWWEVMIIPRDQLRLTPGSPIQDEAAIEEMYPDDHIVLDFRRLARRVRIGTGQWTQPSDWLVNEREFGQYDFRWWNGSDGYPNDPAITDRRIRRTMRMEFENDQVKWGIELEDGSFDTWVIDVPGGLPMDRGLVVFKHHAYTPHKDDNYDTYTFHWDNIRFDGPVVGQYDVANADDVVYLQANGDRPIGDSQTVNVQLDEVGANPVLFGQINSPIKGQVLLSINGGPDISVEPYEYAYPDCTSDFWATFRLPLDPAWLQPGNNTLEWTVGPSNSCVTGPYQWDGFSVKQLQIQMDSALPTAIGVIEADINPQPPIPLPPPAPQSSLLPGAAGILGVSSLLIGLTFTKWRGPQ